MMRSFISVRIKRTQIVAGALLRGRILTVFFKYQWTGTNLTPLSKPVAGEILKDREIGTNPLANVVCRQYAVSDTIGMRGLEAVHAHSCEHAA